MNFYKGVRFRVTALYSVITLATVLGFGVYQYFSLWGEMLDNLDERLRNEYMDFQMDLPLTPKLMAQYRDQISRQNAKVPLQPAVFVQFADLSGRILAWSENCLPNVLLASPEGFRLALIASEVTETISRGYEYPVRVLSARVRTDTGQEVVYQLGVSIRRLVLTTQGFLRALGVAVGVLTLVSLGIGWEMAKRSLRPVRDIIATTQAITAERLQERLTPVGSGDEIDELIHTLNDMIRRLEAGFKQITQFTADVSHELRTPLAVMRGEIEVALEYGKTMEEMKSVLISSLEELDRLTMIANDLLLLARADAQLGTEDHREVDLRELLIEVVADARVLAESRGIHLKTGELAGAVVLGSRDSLRRVFMNLLDNAVKYTPSGGEVRLNCEVRDGSAHVHVEDTGIGIMAEDLPNVFDRFYKASRSRMSREDKGVGLGLSISKAVAEQHGGAISVASVAGKGTTFSVRLPLIREAVKSKPV